MRELLRSLGVGVNFSSLLIAGATFGILYLLGIENWIGLSFSSSRDSWPASSSGS